MQLHHFLLPDFLLCYLAIFALLLGVFSKECCIRSFIKLHFLLLLPVFWALYDLWVSAESASLFGGLLTIDPFGTAVKVIILGAAAAVLLLLSGASNHQNWVAPETVVLILLATAGMMLMVSAGHLLSFYVALELMSLSLYILAGMHRDNALSSEAAIKYFVLGALASGLFLFGCSLLYGFTGTADFAQLAVVLAKPEGLALGALLGIVLILIALFFKISAAPFHMWTPDVYQGAPTVITAFFASAPKVAAIAILVRFLMQPLIGISSSWQQITYTVAILTMAVGAIAALRQSNIKRLLAYSSIGHVGYLLVAISAGSISGIQATLLYSLIYVIMTAGMFGVLLLLRKNGSPIEALDDFKGLATREPLLAAVISIFMLSMAGIPPFAGFFAKFYAFFAAIEEELYILATIGVLSSVIAAYYYLRIIKLMYFDAPVSEPDALVVPRTQKLVITVSVVFNLCFFLYPSPLIQIAREAARSLIR